MSAMGIYTELIGFPAGEGPFGLAKLVTIFVVTGLHGVAALKFRHTMKQEPQPKGAPQALQPFVVLTRQDAALDEQTFAQVLSPAVFEGPCSLVVSLEIDLDDGEVYTFEGRIRVVRGAPGADSVVASNSPN